MKRFSVTYERWDQEAIEAGDTDDRGFIIEGVTLREAIQSGLEYRDPSFAPTGEPSSSNYAAARWLTFSHWNDGTHEYYTSGIIEDRSLHFPNHITPSSRRRIVRLFQH